MNKSEAEKKFAFHISKPVHHRVYGYVELGKWANVLDCLHVPFLDTTYVLVRESVFGSTGGIGKDVVLYAVKDKEYRKEVKRRTITHQFDRKRDCLNNWDLDRIMVIARYYVLDRNFEISGPYKRWKKLEIEVKMISSKECGDHLLRYYVSGEHKKESHLGYEGIPAIAFVFGFCDGNKEREVLINQSARIEDGNLSKKRLRRLLQQWGFLNIPPL
jgi:hypothetical protein